MKRKLKQWWSTYVTNINKTTESLNSDGQHVSPISTKQKKVKTVMVNISHQYQQNNRKLKQWWSTYVTNINKTKESLNSDDQHISPISTKQQKVKTVMVNISHQYQQNKRKLKQWWSTYVTNINKTTES